MGRIGRPKNTEGVPLSCGGCGYRWHWNGNGYFATCPRCHKQIRVRSPPKPIKIKEAFK